MFLGDDFCQCKFRPIKNCILLIMEILTIALWFVGTVLLMKDSSDWFSPRVFFLKTTDTFEKIAYLGHLVRNI